MAFKHLVNTFKRGSDSLVRQIDHHLLQLQGEENDRANVTNSPSSSLGCVRRNYYQRSGESKSTHDPRTQRIFDNGDASHDRIQRYLKDMGVLMMDEVPLVNDPMEIMGHTDGILRVRDKEDHVRVLEIKTINSRGFSALKEAKSEHVAQAHTYMFCLEERRLELQRKYPDPRAFRLSTRKRRLYFEGKYAFLLERHGNDPAKGRRKLDQKVDEAMRADTILYHVTHPIDESVLLYESKDTQELKEFFVKRDEQVMQDVLYKFQLSNDAWSAQELPERECKSKSEGRFCPYLDICFPS